ARGHGVDAIDLEQLDDLPELIRDRTDGRGPVSVIDAVGLEAHIQMFDTQIDMRMGQANVKRWIDEMLPLLSDEADPLGWTATRPTVCPSTRRRTRTRSSRKSRTAPSRSCSSPERTRDEENGSDGRLNLAAATRRYRLDP
ncbi:MAG TPA: hypothetical protein VE127_14950, partial [Solirubrobacteraceae bacterium]|nr:hypothetical protein [Solirubrobacteraceae bacterium]